MCTQTSNAKPDSKAVEINTYNYLAWEEEPLKVYENCTKAVYDEARSSIRNLDKEKGAWLTPMKGHGCANKTSGSKHIHKGGLQLWLKKYKGAWAILSERGRRSTSSSAGARASTTLTSPWHLCWRYAEVFFCICCGMR